MVVSGGSKVYHIKYCSTYTSQWWRSGTESGRKFPYGGTRISNEYDRKSELMTIDHITPWVELRKRVFLSYQRGYTGAALRDNWLGIRDIGGEHRVVISNTSLGLDVLVVYDVWRFHL